MSFAAQLLHFLGEIEAIFGIWAVVLGIALVAFKGAETAIQKLTDQFVAKAEEVMNAKEKELLSHG